MVDGPDATTIIIQGASTASVYSVKHHAFGASASGGAISLKPTCILSDNYWSMMDGGFASGGVKHVQMMPSVIGVSGTNTVSINVDGVVISGNVSGTPKMSIEISSDMQYSHKQITSTEGVILEGSKIGYVDIGSSAPIKFVNVGLEGTHIVDHSGSSCILVGTHFPPQDGDVLMTLGDSTPFFDCH